MEGLRGGDKRLCLPSVGRAKPREGHEAPGVSMGVIRSECREQAKRAERLTVRCRGRMGMNYKLQCGRS